MSTQPVTTDRPPWDDRSGSTRFDDQGGYILPAMGLLIVPLIVMTAFAVDVGAWYAQGSKMQRAADNAALAGVVWLPNTAAADAAVSRILTTNGNSGSYTATYPADRTIKVSITRSGNRYFSGVILKDKQNLNRSATAVFNKAIPLGSPANLMGQDTSSPLTTTGFWSAITAPYTGHDQGDPYTTKCNDNTGAGKKDIVPRANCDVSSASNGSENVDFKPQGFLYAVDVPPSAVGRTVTVQLYDATAMETGTTAGDYTNPSGGFPTEFTLYESDGSDLTLSTDASFKMSSTKCSSGPGSVVVGTTAANKTTWQGKWATLCTFTPARSGIHPLRVKTASITGISPDTLAAGHNYFSVRATSSQGANPTVYSIDNLSIYSPSTGSRLEGSTYVTRLYLANISDEYAGRKLTIDLFDAGDGNGNQVFTMQFLQPPGGAPAVVPNASTPIACKYNSTPSLTVAPPTPQTSANCTIVTKTAAQTSNAGVYNGAWLRVAITIPESYTCSTDCWWTVKYAFGNTNDATDRLVYTVTLYGDPVHLTQ